MKKLLIVALLLSIGSIVYAQSNNSSAKKDTVKTTIPKIWNLCSPQKTDSYCGCRQRTQFYYIDGTVCWGDTMWSRIDERSCTSFWSYDFPYVVKGCGGKDSTDPIDAVYIELVPHYIRKPSEEPAIGGVVITEKAGENNSIEITEMKISLFPNPVRNTANLIIDTQVMGVYDISVLNVIGQRVMEFSKEVTEDDNRVKLNVENFPAGIYSVTVKERAGDYSKSLKLMVTE